MNMNPQRPPPLRPTRLDPNSNYSGLPSPLPSPLSPNMARFPTPPSPNMARFPAPSSPNTARFPTPPSPNMARFPTPPSPNMRAFPMPPTSNPNRRPTTPGSSSSSHPPPRYPTSPIPNRRPTPPDTVNFSNPGRRPTPPQSISSIQSGPPRYPTPPNSNLRPAPQNTRSATMPNMPPRPPATLNPEQESLAMRLKGSFIANEEDAAQAEAEAKKNYERLEDEMLMARKFRKDNKNEKKKLEAIMLDTREKLTNLRPAWESARAANQGLMAKERDMARLRETLELEADGMPEDEQERMRQILMDHDRQVVIAKDKWESVNAVKNKLIDEDKAIKDKDGRREKHFNTGIEGHDKRRYAMRTRMAKACHYTIYYAKRAHNYHIEREKLIPDPNFREALAALEATMQRAEGYLKGPIDEDSGERFWTMHASRSWWVKCPEGPLGSPPSP